jgi:hypothetical protein
LIWGGIGLEFQPRLSLSCLFFAILTQQSFPRTFRAEITVIIIFPCRLFTFVWIWDPHFISLRTRPPFHRERAQQQRYVAHSNAVACKRKEIVESFSSFLVFVTSSATHSYSTNLSATRPHQSWTSARPRSADPFRCRCFSKQPESSTPTATAMLCVRSNTASFSTHLVSRASATSKPEFGHHLATDSPALLVCQSVETRVLISLTRVTHQAT